MSQLSLKEVRGGLEASADRVRNMLPERYKPQLQRFLDRAALTFATSKNRDKLAMCTMQSIGASVVAAAEYGFALDDKFCYAIPYCNSRPDPNSSSGKKIKVWECQATFDYKALVAVARRHKLVTDVRAQDVRERDEFDWYEEDFRQRYRFRKAQGNRGEVVGAFAVVDFPGGGHRFEHMSIEELKLIRSKSKSPDSPAWKDFEHRMYCKAVVKRTLTYVQDDASLGSLIDYDNREFDLDRVVDANGVSETRRMTMDNLADKLHEPKVIDHRDDDVIPDMTDAEKQEILAREREEANAT